MGKWNSAAANMRQLLGKYEVRRTSELISVHKNLVYRVLPQLYRFIPEARDIFEPSLEMFIDNVCAPDREGDYEKGSGKHYYCACNSFGIKLEPAAGYYRNGITLFSQSARTMFEEDYTMALTFWRAGFREKALAHLARALHMLQDMCCLPHATRMTYYTMKKNIHRAYEDLAKMMYPDSVPPQEIKAADLHLFDNRKSFRTALNSIVEVIPQEIPMLTTDPEFAIMHRLYTAEKAVAAFFYRFCRDIFLPADRVHCITDGMRFSIDGELPPLTAKVTEKGIVFLCRGKKQKLCGGRYLYFRAAHRSCGRFTFSPVSDMFGRTVVPSNGRLAMFDPRRTDMQLRPAE